MKFLVISYLKAKGKLNKHHLCVWGCMRTAAVLAEGLT